MEGGNEQDYDEFEMLLGEIPNVTFGNLHPGESGCAVSLPDTDVVSQDTNLYHASQAAKGNDSVTFYGGLTFERPTCINSARGSLAQKLQSDESLGGKIIRETNYQTSITHINQHDSNLPDDQSLTSSLAELSFKDAIAVEPAPPTLVNYKNLPNCTFLVEGQYCDRLDKCIVPSPDTPNSMNLVNTKSEPYSSLTSANGLDKLNRKMIRQDSTKFSKLDICELKKTKLVSFQPTEHFPADLVEQQQVLPGYSSAIPLAPEACNFQVLPNVPVPGVGFSVPAFQQQYYFDAQSPPYMHGKHLNHSQMAWKHMEEEKCHRMHQQFFYLQQLQAHGSDIHPIQASPNGVFGSVIRNPKQPYFGMPVSHQIEQSNRDLYWNKNAVPRGHNQPDLTANGSGLCHYNANGFCGRGESCAFAHSHNQMCASSLACTSALSPKDSPSVHTLEEVKVIFPEKILTRAHGLNTLRAVRPGSIGKHESLNHGNSNRSVSSNGHPQHPSVLNSGYFHLDGQNSRGFSPDNTDFKHSPRLQQKYNSIDEVVGRIYLMAKDQHGCRFLQRKFAEGTPEDVQKIFAETIGHIVELMTDPFGNYLVQKLLEVCNEDQRMQILDAVTGQVGDLVRISCDMHGTRAVQKMIETLRTPEQISMVVSSLKSDIVMLIKDTNGNHVAQCCLQYLQPEFSEFLFDAATAHCVELATDRHGCCVIQKCLRNSDGKRKHHLMSEITSNALVLSQDPFGNYVVQYVIDLKVPWATENVLDQLKGNYGYLSIQKYSSNVVERCLRTVGEDERVPIIQELMNNSRFGQILQDPFGNYVVQCALNQSKGTLHTAFVEAIRPHVPLLRSSPYGKKVLSSNRLKK